MRVAAAALAADLPRARRLGEQARRTTEKLDWSCIVAEFEQALLALTGEAGEGETVHARA